MYWKKAPDVKKEVLTLISSLELNYIPKSKLHSFRSYGSKSRAIARIWGLPKIWQLALSTSPSYCLEVISERFDKLSHEKQKEVLIHELTHVPKNFSGSLVPHIRRGKRSFHKRVHSLVDKLKLLNI